MIIPFHEGDRYRDRQGKFREHHQNHMRGSQEKSLGIKGLHQDRENSHWKNKVAFGLPREKIFLKYNKKNVMGNTIP